MIGQLFTQDFLKTGIGDTPAWQGITDAELDAFIADLKTIYAPFKASSNLNEPMTENEILVRVLVKLGWTDILTQQIASKTRREDVPDMLLFPNPAAKAAALKERREDRRYRHGIAIVESKRWMRPLDRGDATDRLDPGTPSNQMLRYLSTVEVASERAIRWGMLSNGAVWRLYYQGARSRSEEFLELNVAGLLRVPGVQADLEFGADARHGLKLLYCLFQRNAFLIQAWDTEHRTFHEYALAEARRYEERVSQDLGQRVFDTVFPDLANALASGDPKAVNPPTREYLDEVREAALMLLYRLLFVLYAEDRGLLPVRDPRYFNYSLRRIREDVRDKRDKNFAFSAQASRIWDDLRSLFNAIAKGDKALGLPAYNGGLFEDERTPLLARARVSDAQLAPAIDEISRRSEHTLRAWINYRDLSVQHLGGIYERMLEYRLETQGERFVSRPTSFARRGSGTYYTHDDLVKLLIDEAVGPLVRERLEEFDSLIEKWRRKPEIKPAEWQAVDAADPASRILELKVCDPAMGSGHFLVALVDYLADAILENMAHAAEQVAAQRWAKDIANPWASPIANRIADIRSRILKAGREQGWAIDSALLDDRHVIRRMILKRVIHGVDKNLMAVELAKVALWLHTFTVGAPLSFLDHHLRCGDALFGGRIWQLTDELGKLKGAVQQQLNIADGSIRQIETDKGTVTRGLLQYDDLRRVEQARMTMQAIGDLTDIDIAEAHQSKALMDQIEESLLPLKRGLDFLQAMRWASNDDAKGYAETWADLLSQEFGEDLLESLELLAKRGIRPHGERQKRAHAVVQAALARAAEIGFLHWELAFPSVWSAEGGGFDAVIGNPPWDRMKLQEVEWFAERKPEIAKAVRASDRKKMIEKLEASSDPLWREYVAAREMAETAVRVARDSDDYPLLSGGDVNLYSLFVERAASLIQPKGMVGLLTPSGIAADKSAAEFFGSIAGSGRLASLFDFENKKVFFPDIHASFKFCTLVFGGEDRTFEKTRCAFYLHSVAERNDPERALELSAHDFISVNPNTGGAPIFCTKRDAEITTAIYRRQPVLVDRRSDPPKKVWPVRYVTMFHMTNDSRLFKRRDELEKTGWYPVDGNRYKKGQAVAVPLYVGRMVHIYDHRSAHVTVDTDNLHNPAFSDHLTAKDKERFDRYPVPQYWVAESDVPERKAPGWALAFRDIARATDVRTMIAAIIPTVAAGNTLPLVLPEEGEDRYADFAPLLLANLSSLAFDFITRQKAQSTHLNWYIVEQLPLIRPEQFETKIKKQKITDFVREEVLRLSYTAHDLAPFARDLGHDKPPFKWDEDDRRHRMARLDALFFQLYEISRDDAAYILDTFPIVREQDEKAFGRYLTKDLVLAYMNAVAAGDLSSVVNV